MFRPHPACTRNGPNYYGTAKSGVVGMTKVSQPNGPDTMFAPTVFPTAGSIHALLGHQMTPSFWWWVVVKYTSAFPWQRKSGEMCQTSHWADWVIRMRLRGWCCSWLVRCHRMLLVLVLSAQEGGLCSHPYSPHQYLWILINLFSFFQPDENIGCDFQV